MNFKSEIDDLDDICRRVCDKINVNYCQQCPLYVGDDGGENCAISVIQNRLEDYEDA